MLSSDIEWLLLCYGADFLSIFVSVRHSVYFFPICLGVCLSVSLFVNCFAPMVSFPCFHNRRNSFWNSFWTKREEENISEREIAGKNPFSIKKIRIRFGKIDARKHCINFQQQKTCDRHFTRAVIPINLCTMYQVTSNVLS